MISNNRVTQHCIRYGKRCSCRAGSKTCPYDPIIIFSATLRHILENFNYINMSNKNVFYLNAEYETLREWCLEIIRFLQTEFQEEGMFYFTNQITSLIENIDKKKSISKMRALYKEINILVGEEMLTSSQMDSLNNILTKKFNHSIKDEFDKETKKIEVIINRGKIINNKEFELVKRREEQIYADESQIEYAETLRRLMADYE